MAGNQQAEMHCLSLAAIRPQLTDMEIETQVWLAQNEENNRQIESLPRDVRMQRSHDALAMIKKISDVEAVRASNWSCTPMAVRRLCVLSIGLDEKRARDELRKFDALQRGLMWCQVEKLVDDLENAKRSLCGGDMPGRECENG